MAAFRRALRRIDAPVLWSQGFRPQLKMSFCSPLPTSMASAAEWADLELKRPLDIAEFTVKLRESMPEGLPVHQVREVPVNTRSVAARARGYIYREIVPPSAADAVRETLARWHAGEPWPIEVTRKERRLEVDLRDVVEGLTAVEDGAVELEVQAQGAGARIRDVLTGLFGEDSAKGVGGWSTVRVATLFASEPVRPVTGQAVKASDSSSVQSEAGR